MAPNPIQQRLRAAGAIGRGDRPNDPRAPGRSGYHRQRQRHTGPGRRREPGLYQRRRPGRGVGGGGDQVEEGDVLARQDDLDAHQALVAAELQVAQAKDTLDRELDKEI